MLQELHPIVKMIQNKGDAIFILKLFYSFKYKNFILKQIKDHINYV